VKLPDLPTSEMPLKRRRHQSIIANVESATSTESLLGRRVHSQRPLIHMSKQHKDAASDGHASFCSNIPELGQESEDLEFEDEKVELLESILKPKIDDIHHTDWAKDVVYNIDPDKDREEDSDVAPEWTLPTTQLDKDTMTELLVIQAMELRVTRSEREHLVAICPSEPPPSTSSVSDMVLPYMRWL
jgi:hypothetical protein